MFTKLKKIFNREKKEDSVVKDETTQSVEETPKRKYELWSKKGTFRVSDEKRTGYPLYGGEPHVHLSASFVNDYDVSIFSRNEKHFELSVSKQGVEKDYTFDNADETNMYLEAIENYSGSKVFGFEKDVERKKQGKEVAKAKERLKQERKARGKEQEKDVSTLKHGAVWADKIAEAIIDGTEERVVTPKVAKEIIKEMDTGTYEENSAVRWHKEIDKLLYHGGKEPCTVADINVVDGARRVIFPKNGYEVEYSNQSLIITNKRNHEDFSLKVLAIDSDDANELLVGIQNYSGKEPLTERAIYETIDELKKKEKLREHIEKRKANIKQIRKTRAKLELKDPTTWKAGAVEADWIAEGKASGELPKDKAVTNDVAKSYIKGKLLGHSD